jgi:hypothetical protein
MTAVDSRHQHAIHQLSVQQLPALPDDVAVAGVV